MFLVYPIMGLLGFGIANFLAAYLSKSTGHIKGMFLNTFFMLIYLIILVRFFGLEFSSSLITPITLLIIIFAALLNTLGGLFFYKGTQVGSLSVLSPISSAYSLVIVLISILFFNEVLTGKSLISVSAVIFGTIILSTNFKEIKSLKFVITDKAATYGLLALMLWGTGFVLLGLVTKQTGWLLANTYITLTSLIILGLITLTNGIKILSTNRDSYLLAASIGLFTTFGYLGYSLGIERGFASIVGPIVAASPVVTTVLAIIFLKEHLNKIQLVGFSILIFGIILLST